MRPYVPKQGDLVVLSFDPQVGHEQQGRRPALVVSKEAFNRSTGLAFCCPITNTRRGIPFHVPVPVASSLTGVIMVDQIKSLDFTARRVQFVATAPCELIEEVLSILDACIY
jgi:mRNA interferase MazF